MKTVSIISKENDIKSSQNVPIHAIITLDTESDLLVFNGLCLIVIEIWHKYNPNQLKNNNLYNSRKLLRQITINNTTFSKQSAFQYPNVSFSRRAFCLSYLK